MHHDKALHNSRLFTLLALRYTVNHKIRDILFLIITLANLDRFFYSFYIILIMTKFYMQLS